MMSIVVPLIFKAMAACRLPVHVVSTARTAATVPKNVSTVLSLDSNECILNAIYVQEIAIKPVVASALLAPSRRAMTRR